MIVKEVDCQQALERIKKYLDNSTTTPFFVVVDSDSNYRTIRSGVQGKFFRTSSFCPSEDSFPDLDRFFEDLKASTASVHVLLGLGEYAFLSQCQDPFGRLQNFFLNDNRKLVVICRDVRDSFKKMCERDPKFNSQRVCFVASHEDAPLLSVIQFPFNFSVDKVPKGFRNLLEFMEEGNSQRLRVLSDLPLMNTQKIESYFDCLRWENPSFAGQKEWLTEPQWEAFRNDSNLKKKEMEPWRQFLGLKLSSSSNSYLNFVAETASNSEEFENLLPLALLKISHDDSRFPQMYKERKDLMKGKSDGAVSVYLTESKALSENRIFYLTDQTNAEKRTILELLEKIETFPKELKEIYPALYAYLADYPFPRSVPEELRELLNSYFKEYKYLKVTNQITNDFLEKVAQAAGQRPYNQLPTRGSELEKIRKEKKRTFLLWVDALGVEYLAFLQNRSKELKLRMKTHIVRSELPTITAINSDFYKEAQESKPENSYCKVEDLDKLKHEGEQDPKTAGYIAKELQIIDEVLDLALQKLGSKQFDRVLLVSDHGASRLAVLHDQENRWEMAEKGQHSGRCCPQSELDEKPDFAAEGNGFWSLANYDLFRGGRKGTCEVHGGATLEEVVVPIIELSLANTKPSITIPDKKIQVGLKTPARISFFCASPLENVWIKVGEKFYPVSSSTEDWFECVFPDLKTSGKYTAEIYEGDSPIESFEFEIEKEGMKKNDLFGFKRKGSQ